MADYDYFRTVPLNSTEPVVVQLRRSDGSIPDGTTAYLLEFRIKRDQDGSSKTYNSSATGADDAANTPRVFWQGNPALGVAVFYPPSTHRNTKNDLIAYRVRFYEDATVYYPYPPERPLQEAVGGDDIH